MREGFQCQKDKKVMFGGSESEVLQLGNSGAARRGVDPHSGHRKKKKIKRIEFSARDIENKCANMWFSDMRH